MWGCKFDSQLMVLLFDQYWIYCWIKNHGWLVGIRESNLTRKTFRVKVLTKLVRQRFFAKKSNYYSIVGKLFDPNLSRRKIDADFAWVQFVFTRGSAYLVKKISIFRTTWHKCLHKKLFHKSAITNGRRDISMNLLQNPVQLTTTHTSTLLKRFKKNTQAVTK